MTKEFIEAFIKVQQELPKIKKDAENPFFNSKYVPLENVIDEALPILNKNGFGLTQQVTYVTKEEGTGYEPVLKTTLMHSSGEVLEGIMLLMLKSPNPQEQGSAITYARRYSLMSLLGLVGDEDDDGNSASKKVGPVATKTPEKPAPKASKEKLEILKAFMKTKDLTEDKVCSWAGVKKLEDLSEAKAKALIEKWQKEDTKEPEMTPEEKAIYDNVFNSIEEA